MDGDTRGGSALSVRAVSGKPIKFMGVGEGKTFIPSVILPICVISMISIALFHLILHLIKALSITFRFLYVYVHSTSRSIFSLTLK